MRILLTLQSDIPNATVCFRAGRLGDHSIGTLTSCTFQSVLIYLLRPCFPVLNVLPVSSYCLSHIEIVFAPRTALLRGIMNLHSKALSVASTDFCFINPPCSHVQSIMATEMRLTTDHKKITFIHMPPPQQKYYLL